MHDDDDDDDNDIDEDDISPLVRSHPFVSPIILLPNSFLGVISSNQQIL